MSLISFNIEDFVRTVGLIGVFAVVFAESGLLIGFFLPGDSLLFVAGFLASQGLLDIHVLAIGVAFFAILGDSVGYYLGKRMGKRIFKKENKYIKEEYLHKTEDFYSKHGGKTIVLARFVPIVRTFAPFVAGASKMDYHRFLSFNIFGGILWGAGLSYLGYFLGNSIPNIDKYLMPVTLLIIVLSFAPGIIHYLSEEKNRTFIKDILIKYRDLIFKKNKNK
jgi:membrane-associated protein